MIIDNLNYVNNEAKEYINEKSLSIRAEYIKILNKLVHKHQFRSQTFYIACFYFDFIMQNNQEINADNAAIGALLLASKFDENDSLIPKLSNFQSMSNKIYFTIDDLKRNEFSCLEIMNYKLNYLTAYHFVNFFCSHGVIFVDEIIESNDNIRNSPSEEPVSMSIIDRKLGEKVYNLIKEILLYFIEGNIYIIER